MTGHRKLYLLCTIGLILLIRMLSMQGPADILQKIDFPGDQLSSGGRQFSLTDINNTASDWILMYNMSLQDAYKPQYNGNINPHNYRLVLDEPMACMDQVKETPKKVLLVLVATVHRNFNRRQAIRETWGSLKKLNGLDIVTLFLLAKNENPILEEQILSESSEHHDLLMEDFQDSYKNLTLKTIMAMKWASTHCPHASYVMKTDDDMYVSYQNLLNYIADSKAPSTNLALGLVIAGEAPIRNPGSKWYMPSEIYPESVYPPWLSGGGFVLSGDLPDKIYAVSLNIRYIHLEDVYVGICLERLRIAPVMNRQFSNLHIDYSYCRFRYLITAHFVQPTQLRTMWRELLLQKPCWPWT